MSVLAWRRWQVTAHTLTAHSLESEEPGLRVMPQPGHGGMAPSRLLGAGTLGCPPLVNTTHAQAACMRPSPESPDRRASDARGRGPAPAAGTTAAHLPSHVCVRRHSRSSELGDSGPALARTRPAPRTIGASHGNAAACAGHRPTEARSASSAAKRQGGMQRGKETRKIRFAVATPAERPDCAGGLAAVQAFTEGTVRPGHPL